MFAHANGDKIGAEIDGICGRADRLGLVRLQKESKGKLSKEKSVCSAGAGGEVEDMYY